MGVEGRKLNKYSKEFKLSAVEDVLEYQMGLRETARKYGVTHKMVQTWIKIYLDKGISYFQDDSTEESKITSSLAEIPSADYISAKKKPRISQKDEERLDEDVRKELNRLRMENEYLKELNALVRKKEKSLTKRKRK